MFTAELYAFEVGLQEPQYCSQYSNWLWAGRMRGGSLSSCIVKNLHFSISSKQALGPTQPAIPWVQMFLSPGVKWPGHEGDHSPPTTAHVKKMWIYASAPPNVLVV
jgi:hypothetical protein